MNLLALDCTTDRLSIAAAAGDRVAVRSAVGARRHAALLGPLALDVLSEIGLSLGRLDRIILADGPGSFTGLRVGTAWVKAVLLAYPVPLFVGSTLLARAAGPDGRAVGNIVGIGSALRDELYAAGYRLTEGRVDVGFEPTVLAAGQTLPNEFHPDRIVGDGLPPELDGWDWARGIERLGGVAGLPDARGLIGLAERDGGLHLVEEPSGWEPHYGRPAEAEARWEREHGRPLVDSSRSAR